MTAFARSQCVKFDDSKNSVISSEGGLEWCAKDIDTVDTGVLDKSDSEETVNSADTETLDGLDSDDIVDLTQFLESREDKVLWNLTIDNTELNSNMAYLTNVNDCADPYDDYEHLQGCTNDKNPESVDSQLEKSNDKGPGSVATNDATGANTSIEAVTETLAEQTTMDIDTNCVPNEAIGDVDHTSVDDAGSTKETIDDLPMKNDQQAEELTLNNSAMEADHSVNHVKTVTPPPRPSRSPAVRSMSVQLTNTSAVDKTPRRASGFKHSKDIDLFQKVDDECQVKYRESNQRTVPEEARDVNKQCQSETQLQPNRTDDIFQQVKQSKRIPPPRPQRLPTRAFIALPEEGNEKRNSLVSDMEMRLKCESRILPHRMLRPRTGSKSTDLLLPWYSQHDWLACKIATLKAFLQKSIDAAQTNYTFTIVAKEPNPLPNWLLKHVETTSQNANCHEEVTVRLPAQNVCSAQSGILAFIQKKDGSPASLYHACCRDARALVAQPIHDTEICDNTRDTLPRLCKLFIVLATTYRFTEHGFTDAVILTHDDISFSVRNDEKSDVSEEVTQNTDEASITNKLYKVIFDESKCAEYCVHINSLVSRCLATLTIAKQLKSVASLLFLLLTRHACHKNHNPDDVMLHMIPELVKECSDIDEDTYILSYLLLNFERISHKLTSPLRSPTESSGGLNYQTYI